MQEGSRNQQTMELSDNAVVLLIPILLLSLALVPFSASAQTQSTGKLDPIRSARLTNTEPAKASGKIDIHPQPGQNYVIGPGDVLGVNVWREPEISQKLVVRPDGMISLPLIGDVSATEQTPEQLAHVVEDKLKSYLTSPQVTVIIVEVHSKWFVVMGQAARPGRYPLTRPTTVMEAVSEAGGFHDFAKTRKIYILRVENGKAVRHPFNYDKVVKGKSPEENIEVHSGDTIIVP